MTRWLTVVPLLWVASASVSLCQPSAVGKIVGTVHSLPDSALLARAHILATPTWRTAFSTDSGAFELTGLPPGNHQLRIRRLGYVAIDTAVIMTAGASVGLEIWLRRLPQSLAEVHIRGKKLLVPSHMRAIYERAERSNGYLITAQDIQQRNPLDAKVMLEGIPGVRVLNYSVIFARCQAPPGASRNAGFVSSNKIHVYVNGHRVTNTGDRQEAFAAIQSTYPSTIELIEVYTGIARIPAEYLADACAVVAFWTK